MIDNHSPRTELSRWQKTSQKIKFALKKEELDRKITELDASTLMLSRLRIAGSSLQDNDQRGLASRSIVKLSSFLSKVHEYTKNLYFAIASGCPKSCHSLHRFKLYLEDWSAPLLKKKPTISFRIESFPLPPAEGHREWHAANVQALTEDEDDKEEQRKRKSSIRP